MNRNKIIKTVRSAFLLQVAVFSVLGLTLEASMPAFAQTDQSAPDRSVPDLDRPSPDPSEQITPGTSSPGTPLETVPSSPESGTNLPSPLDLPPNPLDPAIAPGSAESDPSEPNTPGPFPTDPDPTEDTPSVNAPMSPLSRA